MAEMAKNIWRGAGFIKEIASSEIEINSSNFKHALSFLRRPFELLQDQVNILVEITPIPGRDRVR